MRAAESGKKRAPQVSGSRSWIRRLPSGGLSTPWDSWMKCSARVKCSAERKPELEPEVQLRCGRFWTPGRGVSSECVALARDREKARRWPSFEAPARGKFTNPFFPELKSSRSEDPGRGRGQDLLLAVGQWAPPPQGHAPASFLSARAGRCRQGLGRAVSALWPCLAAP